MSKCSESSRTGSTTTITITLENGVVSVDKSSPDNICVNDTVEWTCATNAWAVQFIGEGSPGGFDRQQAPVSPLHVSGSAGQSAGVTVSTKAAMHKVWDYVVAVWDGTTIRTVDPEIVIGTRP